MKILVCISNVPDTTTKINFTPDKKAFITQGVQFIINPYDEIALTRALELTEKDGGSVTVVNVGEQTDATLRKALAVGATDAIRVNASPLDAFYVAKQIAAVAASQHYDLILTGRESIDFNGAQVPSLLGELLGIPSFNGCKSLVVENGQGTLHREIEGGIEVVACPFPLVAGASEGLAEPRIPNMRGIMSARSKPLTVVEPVDAAPLTEVIGFDKPKPRSTVNLIPPDQPEKLIELLHTEAKIL